MTEIGLLAQGVAFQERVCKKAWGRFYTSLGNGTELKQVRTNMEFWEQAARELDRLNSELARRELAVRR